MTRNATDALDLFVLRLIIKPIVKIAGADGYEDLAFLKETQEPDSDTELFYYYTEFLTAAWMVLAPFVGLACVGIGYFLATLDGAMGHTIGFAFFLFVTCFCLVGMFDALWRYLLLAGFRRYHGRRARQFPDSSNRLVKLARRNDASLLFQVAAGVFFAWRFS